MQAVILVGGLGTRLGEMTNDLPKPMMDINGKPFLYYLITMLKSQRIIDVLLCVGYLGEKIEDYFGDGSDFGVKISYSYESEPLGTGGALKNAEKLLDDKFILLNGDTYLDMDYNILINFSSENNFKGIIVVKKSEDSDINNISIGDDSFIVDYKKENGGNFNFVDAGVQVFSKAILDFIPINQKFSLEKDIFSKLIDIEQLKAYEVDSKFYDIGTPERLYIFKKYLDSKE